MACGEPHVAQRDTGLRMLRIAALRSEARARRSHDVKSGPACADSCVVLAETVQDQVGAWFGVSGGVVVLVVIIALWAHQADAESKKPVMSQACSTSAHNQCPGRVLTGKRSDTKACSCTCHGAMSDSCGTKGRHDLCAGNVWNADGGTKSCRCSCHLPRT